MRAAPNSIFGVLQNMSDSELLSIFWLEVGEYLEALNAQLLQVEMAPTDHVEKHATLVRELNRVAHSMKGAARAVGIGLIETVAHYMEEVFGAAMEGTIKLTPDVCDVLYDGIDIIQNAADGQETSEEALNRALANMERVVAQTMPAKLSTDTQEIKPVLLETQMYQDDDDEYTDLQADTGNKQKRDAPQQIPAIKPPEQNDQTQSKKRITSTISQTSLTPISPHDMSTVMVRPAEETVRVTVSKLDQLMAEVTELFVARMHGEENVRAMQQLRQMHSKWQREWRSVRAAYIRLVRRVQDNEDEASSELATLFRFLEVNQRYLAEANRQLGQLAQSASQDNLRLGTLTDQLQDEISRIRMTPFETVTGGFQRLVRDLARDMNKPVNLDIEGAHVEIDKAVLDELKDPVMHILRNAVDHGIEEAVIREMRGKPILGQVKIAVQQRGSEIVIIISDDGKGIDPAQVRRSIISNGLMSDADAAALSDDDVRGYIFYSGLSTNSEITAISGRGMGMDIVRDRVESLRGRVSVQSAIGQGTTVTLSVPVSLTRLRCVLLRVGEQQFAIPSVMVQRMDKIARSEVFTAEGHDMLMVNERPIPLVSMGSILDIPPKGIGDGKMSYLALQATDRVIAFEVDDVFSEQELVLKPLGPELARARYVSGASLLGTGDVIIVLDANDLVRSATGTALPRRRSVTMTMTMRPIQRRVRVLVVDDSITTRTLEKNILETAGYEVHVAIDGKEAWEMLPQHDFDVIISDVEMPQMTGLELTARIKSSQQYSHIPVVLLTSLGKPEQQEAGLKAGANAYLVKSRFDQGALLETIQSFV